MTEVVLKINFKNLSHFVKIKAARATMARGQLGF